MCGVCVKCALKLPTIILCHILVYVLVGWFVLHICEVPDSDLNVETNNTEAVFGFPQSFHASTTIMC